MDKTYLLDKLLMWSKIFYGEDAKVFSKVKKGLYVFGTKGSVNVLSKPLAIFLCIGELPNFTPKTKQTKKKRK